MDPGKARARKRPPWHLMPCSCYTPLMKKNRNRGSGRTGCMDCLPRSTPA